MNLPSPVMVNVHAFLDPKRALIHVFLSKDIFKFSSAQNFKIGKSTCGFSKSRDVFSLSSGKFLRSLLLCRAWITQHRYEVFPRRAIALLALTFLFL